MSGSDAQAFDPTDGTTPVTMPARDPCCQCPCDPPWLSGPACITFYETRSDAVVLQGDVATNEFGRGLVTITVTYAHSLCLAGKQHGGLAYTLTLLPGEKRTLYESDRFRRTTTDTERFSAQTTFSQFVSALHQQQTSNSSAFLSQVLNSQTQSSSAQGGGGVNLGIFNIGGGGDSASTSSSSGAVDFSAQASASQFTSVVRMASQYTDLQRSTVVSAYEDSETVSITQRTLVNNNVCYAVNYFVRKVMDVYLLTTKVTGVTFVVKVGTYVSPSLTPAQIGQVPAQFRPAVEAALPGLPKVGETVQQPQMIAVPTDGLVYDPELAHCCAQDPELEQQTRIKLEREQAEAQKVGLEIQLMALEVQRRRALLAAGALEPFRPAPVAGASSP